MRIIDDVPDFFFIAKQLVRQDLFNLVALENARNKAVGKSRQKLNHLKVKSADLATALRTRLKISTESR